jgi:hypothetical protein
MTTRPKCGMHGAAAVVEEAVLGHQWKLRASESLFLIPLAPHSWASHSAAARVG